MGKASTLMKKLEAPHPEGLSSRQLFLTNEDLLPVRPEHKTWNHWNFASFRSSSQDRMTDNSGLILDCRQFQLEHLCHCFFHDQCRFDLVAGIPLCYYRLFARRTYSCSQRSTWSCLWSHLSLGKPNDFRYLWFAMARLQPYVFDLAYVRIKLI